MAETIQKQIPFAPTYTTKMSVKFIWFRVRLSTKFKGSLRSIQCYKWKPDVTQMRYTCLKLYCLIINWTLSNEFQCILITVKYVHYRKYIWQCRLHLTHLGLVSHICVIKNNPHFHSNAYVRGKSLYLSYRPRGIPTKQCQAIMSFNSRISVLKTSK